MNEGALRRLYDDPLAVPEDQRTHFAGCPECKRRFDEVAADARRAAQALAVPAVAIDQDAALAAVRRRPPVAPVRKLRLPGGRWRPVLAAGLAAAALAGLAVTGTAEQLLTIAQPDQVAVVPVTTSELAALPDLSQFGSVAWHGETGLQPAAGRSAAAEQAGFAVPAVGYVPAGVPADVTYAVMGSSTGSFTFNAAKAEAWATGRGESLPAMPAGLDGSTLTLSYGPAVAELFGGFALQEGPRHAGGAGMVVGKMRVPTLQSTGPTVKEIEDYLLSLPGISPQLAAQIRAVGDPAQTLPLPVPVDRATSRPVTIDGVRGVLVGDDTGLGAGVIWVKGGYVYGVAGTLSQDQVLAVARSLS